MQITDVYFLDHKTECIIHDHTVFFFANKMRANEEKKKLIRMENEYKKKSTLSVINNPKF